MTDLKKRNTLKLIGGSGLLVASGPAAATLLAEAGPVGDARAPLSQAEIEITIVDSSSVTEHSVIVENHSSHDMAIRRFMPGTVFFNDHWLSLNDAFANTLLAGRTLPAGHAISARAEVEPLAAGETGDYLWAQQSVWALTEATDIVTLGASLQQGQAVVFAPAQRALFA